MAKINFSKSDQLILIGALLVVFVGVSGLLLWKDSSTDNGSAVILGEVEKQGKDVRFKSHSRYDWLDLDNRHPIALGDQVFTGQNSTAQVSFSNHQKMTVLPNSLVKFDSKPGQPLKIQVIAGEFKAELKKDQKIEIEICGKKHLIEAEDQNTLSVENAKDCNNVSIKSDKNKIKINVENKPLQSKTTSNHALTAALTQIAKTDESAAMPEKAPEIPAETPIAFLDNVQLYQKKISRKPSDQTLKIHWTHVNEAKKYKVVWSNTDDFQNPESDETTLNFYEIKIQGKDSLYFKVLALNDKTQSAEYSEIGKSTIAYPSILIEESEKKLSYNARTSSEPVKTTDVQIKWQKIPTIKEYRVEFSADPQFSKIHSTLTAQDNKITFSLNQLGTTYYRVHALNEELNVVTSSRIPGQINYIRNFDLTSPSIQDSYKKMSFFFQKSEGQFIKLRWNNPSKEKASQYFIEISTTSNFQSISYSYKTDKESLFLNHNLNVGLYYWRVKSYNSQMISDWSEPAEIKILSSRQTASEPLKKDN